MRIQEHIINKVTVDINTNSNKVAEELKNSIDTYLKEEIFPLIESFFESISSEDSIKLIPKLSLNIDVNSQNFSITSEISRRELKKQISNKLEEVINQPEAHNIKIEEKTYQNSKADTFFSFLENGTFSWWNNHTRNFNFSKKDLYEITETSSFSTRFLKVLQSPVQKVRLLNQFLNTELLILFLGIVNKPPFFNQLLTEINAIDDKILTSESKKELWNAFSHYAQKGELLVFLEYVLSIIKSVENKKDKQSEEGLKLFLSQVISKHSEIKITIPNEIISKIDSLTFSEYQKFNLTKKTKNQLKSNDAEVTNKSNVSLDTIQNKNENISLEETEKLKNTTEEDKADTEKNKEILREEKLFEKEARSNYKFDSDLRVDRDSLENEIISPEEIASSDQSKEETIQGSESLDSPNLSDQVQNEEEGTVRHADNITFTESNNTISELSENDNLEKRVLSERSLETKNAKEAITSDSANPEVLKNTNIQPDQASIISNKKVQTHFKTDEQQSITPLKNIKELFKGFTKPKSYIINNAGLILIHPFLKQFFTSCNLLNEKNQISNPSEAVHLLHYVATKQEKQLESNLIFEKFLCSIPIHQTIERDITLSDEKKEKAESLLKSVAQNWEILKNSSPDLIRNEFIQRQGKLDLTKDNPQLTIERKTQDILLDKLPWSYSLCKLPWMKTLLFTDW